MKLQWITFAVMLLGAIAGCGNQQGNTVNTAPANNAVTDTNENTAAKVEEVENVDVSSAAEVSANVEGSSGTQEIVFGDRFPEVLKVKITPSKNGQWRFAVTLSSAYDTPQRYADAWRVLDAQGQELGIRVLGHDHASEQPFTRSGSIQVPSEINVVFVEGRDQDNGWSGQRFKVEMPDQK